MKLEEWWVVASQDCDIASQAEPRVEFLRAFWTSDRGVLRMARLNSARKYLLARRQRADDQDEGLVVDATVHLSVEKESLLEVRPSEEVPRLEQDATRRFGEWLARRYSRPAISNPLVEAIQKPLVKALQKLQRKEDEQLWRTFEEIEEVLFSAEGAAPPFQVSLLCILDPKARLGELEQADVMGWFSEVLEREGQVRLKAVDFRTRAAISLADYLALISLPLDEFSSEG